MHFNGLLIAINGDGHLVRHLSPYADTRSVPSGRVGDLSCWGPRGKKTTKQIAE